MAWLASALAARAEIEFVGILVTSDAARFALTDTETGATSWVQRGQKFSGYTVARFDPAADVLTLTRDGADLRVPLKDDAKIKAARLELTGTITFGTTEKIEVERATLLFERENVFPLREGLTYTITPRRLPDGNILYAIAIERTKDPRTRETIAAPRVVALPDHRFSVQFGDDLGFTFTPKPP